MSDPDVRRGVGIAAAFFAASGVLELSCAAVEIRPLSFWPLWEAAGRTALYFLMAAGLWRRSAVCRLTALIYCIAVVATYAVVLGLALFHADLRYPTSLVVESAFQVPSSLLLIGYFRSERAALVFTEPLL